MWRLCMRDHYEGTPLSVARWRLISVAVSGRCLIVLHHLTFKVDGKQCFNERPVSTQQSGFVYVSQMRSWLPREIGGVLWFGNDDANMVAFTPIYCSIYRSSRVLQYSWCRCCDLQRQECLLGLQYGEQHGLSTLQPVVPNFEGGSRQSRQQLFCCPEAGGGQGARTLCPESSAGSEVPQRLWCREGAADARSLEAAPYLFSVVKYNDMIIKPTTRMELSSVRRRGSVHAQFVRDIQRNMLVSSSSRLEINSFVRQEPQDLRVLLVPLYRCGKKCGRECSQPGR